MSIQDSLRDLLNIIGPGRMMSTAYDTAWVARLDDPIGMRALDWLREHQLPDGSWGAESPKYFHDRLICTLAAAIALAKSRNPRDEIRLQRARFALETVVSELANESVIETIGFEMIIPTLFREAEALGLIRQSDFADLPRLHQKRAAKLSSLPGGVINRYVTLAFSAEMAGADGLRLLDIPRLQEDNGSIGHSPSATAYYALSICPGDQDALSYLHKIAQPNGGIPDVAPFDNFERSWALWNLSLTQSLDSDVLQRCQPHLDFLERAWKPKQGAGWADGYTVKDADDTGVTYEVLTRYGRSVNIEAVLSYEQEDHFRCFPLEANPSVSANIHVLGALRSAGFPASHPSVQKVLNFLHSTAFWFDKWHSSPYYPTAHAIIACAGYADDVVADAIPWILQTQNRDGSWGYYLPTAEETAYCLQALSVWLDSGHDIPYDVLRRGSEWLVEHMKPPYPPLWIGKCLYSPTLVVRSTILSALMLVSEQLRVSVC